MPDLDKFYTQKHVSKYCFEFLHSQLIIPEDIIYLEPSAGDGSFLDLLPHYVALDIAPEDDRIEKQDYLKYMKSSHRISYSQILTTCSPS